VTQKAQQQHGLLFNLHMFLYMPFSNPHTIRVICYIPHPVISSNLYQRISSGAIEITKTVPPDFSPAAKKLGGKTPCQVFALCSWNGHFSVKNAILGPKKRGNYMCLL